MSLNSHFTRYKFQTVVSDGDRASLNKAGQEIPGQLTDVMPFSSSSQEQELLSQTTVNSSQPTEEHPVSKLKDQEYYVDFLPPTSHEEEVEQTGSNSIVGPEYDSEKSSQSFFENNSTLKLLSDEEEKNDDSIDIHTPVDQIRKSTYWHPRPTWVDLSPNSKEKRLTERQTNPADADTPESVSVREFEYNNNYTDYGATPGDPDLEPLHEFSDPLVDNEYFTDQRDRLYELEPRFRPDPDYMKNQLKLKWEDRTRMAQWIFKTSTGLKAPPSVPFLALNCLDRVLVKWKMDSKVLLGVTASCFLLAFKHETAYHPDPKPFLNFIKLPELGFGLTELIETEFKILEILEARLSYPNPMEILNLASIGDGFHLKTKLTARFLLETMVYSEFSLKYPPSLLACFSYYIAIKITNRGSWNPMLEEKTGCSRVKLSQTSNAMLEELARTLDEPLTPSYAHYDQDKYLKVSHKAYEWVVTWYSKYKKRQNKTTSKRDRSRSCSPSKRQNTNV